MSSIRQTPHTSIRAFDDLAADWAARLLEAERAYVAAMWLDPVAGHDAAFDYGLSGDRFADSRLGFVYAYLAISAERGIRPTITGCLRAAQRHGVILDIDWLYYLVTDDTGGDRTVEEHAPEVARYAGDRERAAMHHLTAVARLMVDSDRYEVVVRERRQARPVTRIPKRLRNPRRRRRGNGVRKHGRQPATV